MLAIRKTGWMGSVEKFLTALLTWIYSDSVHNIYRTLLTVRIMFTFLTVQCKKMQTQSRLFNYFAALSISVKISSFSRQSSDSSVFKSLKKGILWFIQYTLIIKTNYIKCGVNLQYSFIKQFIHFRCSRNLKTVPWLQLVAVANSTT